MPHLPESARLWLERAEIDYIGPFVKAWAAFNSWFRVASNSRRDVDGLRYVRQQLNPVRSSIKPLLRALERDGSGNPVPDTEQAQKFKLLVRDLHVCLDSYHLEVSRDERLERISFRSVCLSSGVNLPRDVERYGYSYKITKQNKKWISVISASANPADVRLHIEQDTFDVDALQVHQQFANVSVAQRANLLGLYNQCNPRPLTDLFGGGGSPIRAGDIDFRCTDEQLFAGLMEIIYSMRNALLHGEVQPHQQAFAAYEPAYRIVMSFLEVLRH